LSQTGASPRSALVSALQAGACSAGLGVLSLAAHTPFLIPPLGATTYLFVTAPESPASAPRNAVYGHVIAGCAGWISLWSFGLDGQQTTLASSCDLMHMLSAAAGLALSTFLLLLLKVPHPPAPATTLVVSLGLLPHAWQVPLIGGTALILALEAHLLQRLAGRPLPIWAPQAESTPR
jgi:CBS-domain-containing membrane protein